MKYSKKWFKILIESHNNLKMSLNVKDSNNQRDNANIRKNINWENYYS